MGEREQGKEVKVEEDVSNEWKPDEVCVLPRLFIYRRIKKGEDRW